MPAASLEFPVGAMYTHRRDNITRIRYLFRYISAFGDRSVGRRIRVSRVVWFIRLAMKTVLRAKMRRLARQWLAFRREPCSGKAARKLPDNPQSIVRCYTYRYITDREKFARKPRETRWFTMIRGEHLVEPPIMIDRRILSVFVFYGHRLYPPR